LRKRKLLRARIAMNCQQQPRATLFQSMKPVAARKLGNLLAHELTVPSQYRGEGRISGTKPFQNINAYGKGFAFDINAAFDIGRHRPAQNIGRGHAFDAGRSDHRAASVTHHFGENDQTALYKMNPANPPVRLIEDLAAPQVGGFERGRKFPEHRIG